MRQRPAALLDLIQASAPVRECGKFQRNIIGMSAALNSAPAIRGTARELRLDQLELVSDHALDASLHRLCRGPDAPKLDRSRRETDRAGRPEVPQAGPGIEPHSAARPSDALRPNSMPPLSRSPQRTVGAVRASQSSPIPV